MDGAIAVLRQQGAVIVDPADARAWRPPSVTTTSRPGDEHAKGRNAGYSINSKYGMKRDFNVWATEITEISYVISGAGTWVDRLILVDTVGHAGSSPPSDEIIEIM